MHPLFDTAKTSRSKGKSTHPQERLPHADDSSFQQRGAALFKYAIEMATDILRAHVTKAENDGARQPRAACGDELGEIQVVSQKDALGEARPLENFGIRKLMQAQLGEVLGNETLTAKLFPDRGRDAHVEEEFHEADAGSKASSASQAAYCKACRTSSTST